MLGTGAGIVAVNRPPCLEEKETSAPDPDNAAPLGVIRGFDCIAAIYDILLHGPSDDG